MTGKPCKNPECELVLGSRNKSGFCTRHYRKQKKCKKCGGVCSKSATYCEKCGFMARSFKATHFVVCQFGDCQIMTNAKYNLCVDHYRSYWKCEAPGCQKMLKYSNKWQLCTDHHDMTRKLINNGIKPRDIEPLPLVKRRLNSHIVGVGKQKAKVVKLMKKVQEEKTTW